ncbi:MAG: hypothetical protein AABX48_01540 [Nanoarchaeota archaeon]
MDDKVRTEAQKYKNISKVEEALKSVNYNPKTGMVEGSNPIYICLLNPFLSERGLRVTKPSDLPKILECGDIDLSSICVDHSLILRPGHSNNKGYDGDNAFQSFALYHELLQEALENGRSEFGTTMLSLNGATIHQTPCKFDDGTEQPSFVFGNWNPQTQIIEDARLNPKYLGHSKFLGSPRQMFEYGFFNRLDSKGLPIIEKTGKVPILMNAHPGLFRIIYQHSNRGFCDTEDLTKSAENGRILIFETAD